MSHDLFYLEKSNFAVLVEGCGQTFDECLFYNVSAVTKEFLGCRLNDLLIVILQEDVRVALDLCHAETFDWTYDEIYSIYMYFFVFDRF